MAKAMPLQRNIFEMSTSSVKPAAEAEACQPSKNYF
jgi:hypothetical protein